MIFDINKNYLIVLYDPSAPALKHSPAPFVAGIILLNCQDDKLDLTSYGNSHLFVHSDFVVDGFIHLVFSSLAVIMGYSINRAVNRVV